MSWLPQDDADHLICKNILYKLAHLGNPEKFYQSKNINWRMVYTEIAPDYFLRIDSSSLLLHKD
jgi:hypothetical protein